MKSTRDRTDGRRVRHAMSLSASLLFLLFLLVPPASADTLDPVLILYAFGAEGEVLAGEMETAQTDTVLGRIVHLGRLSDHYVILAESGTGMTNAAMTVQKLIDLYEPGLVTFSGIAGAVDSSVRIGDIVINELWFTHDYGYLGPGGLEPSGIYVYFPPENKIIELTYFSVEPGLIAKADTLAHDTVKLGKIGGREPKVIIGGVGISGNTFIDNFEKRVWLSRQFKALTVDMESAAVAQVCTVNDVPFIIFRSASDLAGGSGSATARKELNDFFKVAADNSARVVMEFLGRL